MMLKKYMAFALIMLIAPLALSAKIFLVAVGISDYPGSDKDLRLPANDAKTITKIYKHKKADVVELIDDQATSQAIIATMDSLYADAGPDDIVVLYFSGHGYKGGFLAYNKPLPYSRIRKAMARCKSHNKMIFADACFSGRIRTQSTSASDSTEVAQSKKANVMLFLSSRNNETSIERDDMKNGYFTAYLDYGLRKAADANKDNIITARELYDYVHRGVIKLSDDKQHPVMWGNFDDNMPVMVW